MEGKHAEIIVITWVSGLVEYIIRDAAALGYIEANFENIEAFMIVRHAQLPIETWLLQNCQSGQNCEHDR